jgi:hypothetical protein
VPILENQQPLQLPVIKGRTFTNETVQLTGRRYENCQFVDNCTIMYAGGPGEMSDCLVGPDTVWGFSPQVATILQVLGQCGWNIGYGTGPDAEPIRFPSDAM